MVSSISDSRPAIPYLYHTTRGGCLYSLFRYFIARQIAGFCEAAVSASNTRAILSAAVAVVSFLKKPDTTRTELPMRTSVTQSGRRSLVRRGLAEVLARKQDRGAHFQQAVIDTGVGRVLRALQFFKGKVCGDDKRPAAAVAAVHDVVNLFQPVFRAALHAEIVKDKQRVTAKAGDVFVPALKAGGKVV